MTDTDLRERGRATTDADKRAIVERLYAAWTSPGCCQLRLGQMIEVARNLNMMVPLFVVEDEELVEILEKFASS